MATWLRCVLALIIFCHGFIYVRIGAVLPGPIAGWNGRSAVLGDLVRGQPLVLLVRVVHVVAGIALLACAVAMACAHGSWRPVAIVGGLVGLVAFTLFFDGQTSLLLEEGVIGAVVSVALAAAAVALSSSSPV